MAFVKVFLWRGRPKVGIVRRPAIVPAFASLAPREHSATVLLNEELLLAEDVGRRYQGDSPLNTMLALHHRAPFPKAVRHSCPRCGCPLTLHQPDPDLADRLLATCDECKSWYLTDPEGTELDPIHQPKDRCYRH